MLSSFVPSAIAAGAALLYYAKHDRTQETSGLPIIRNLVTFGDSYTDDIIVGDGGVPWPTFLAEYSKGDVSVYNFARAGATCSNKLTPRSWPDVMESEVNEYDDNTIVGSGGTTYIRPRSGGEFSPLLSEETVYSIWLGTNDVGFDQLMTNPREGVSVVNTTACVFDWMREMYNRGARNFLLQNMIPLYLTPFYSPNGHTEHYWDFPHNQTAWSIQMAELVRAGNELQALRARYVAPSQFPGARIGLFDSYGLFKDMYTSPWKYLVGPDYNVVDSISSCHYPPDGTVILCETKPPEVHGSYLWWDEAHPSEQANRVVAQHVLAALGGDGPFVTWYGAV